MDFVFRNKNDNRDLDALNWFGENRKERIQVLKDFSFERSSKWLEFREAQLIIIHQLVEGIPDDKLVKSNIDWVQQA